MSSDPIVVGTDGSATAEVAVAKAAELARALGAQVHVVTAYSPRSSGAWMSGAAGVAVLDVSDDEHPRQMAHAVVDRTRSQLQREGVAVTTHVCEGEPAEALLTIAADQQAQMIVVGNRGMAGARRVLGSVPNRVSHRARCGVLIVPTS